MKPWGRRTQFADNFVILPAIGTRGGLLLAVDDEHYHITHTDMGIHSVTAKIAPASGLAEWCLTVVYGPQDDSAKLQFLGELRWLQHSVNDEWLVIYR